MVRAKRSPAGMPGFLCFSRSHANEPRVNDRNADGRKIVGKKCRMDIHVRRMANEPQVNDRNADGRKIVGKNVGWTFLSVAMPMNHK
jgi:hypothetical protein